MSFSLLRPPQTVSHNRTCSVEYKSTSAFLVSPLALPASLQPHPPALVTLPRPQQHSLFLHQAEHSLTSTSAQAASCTRNILSFPSILADSSCRAQLKSFFYFIEVQLIYNIVCVWGVQQSGSVIYVCVCICIYILKILFHYSLLL